MSNKYSFLFLISFCATLGLKAQSQIEINLPEGGKEISFSAGIHLYVTKNQVVSIDDDTFKYYDDISNSIINQEDIPGYINSVLLFADEDTRFHFIQRIKEQISLVNNRVALMTESSADSHRGLVVMAYSFGHKKKNFREIKTLEEELSNEEFNSGPMAPMPPPPAPPAMWYQVVEEEIYSGDKKAIQRNLEAYSAVMIRLEEEKQLFHKDKRIGAQELSSLIDEHDLLFLEFGEDLLYRDYIFAIDQIRKSQRDLEAKDENSAYLIEISEELGDHFKELGIVINSEN